MRAWLAALAIILVATTARAESLIRVRLKTQEAELVISGTGLRMVGMTENFKPVAIPQNETLRIKRFQKDGRSFWLINGRTRTQIMSSALLVIEGSQMRAGSQILPHKILIASSGRQKMDLVGIMPLENYLTGVVASEMPLSWPIESLKAQAVAARSYAMAVMKERSRRIFHVESNILDQVFRPLAQENGDDPLVKKALQAVRETEGQRLTVADGRTLKAFFHSDCGGKTVSAKSVWGNAVEAGQASDASCPSTPRANWELNVPKAKIFAGLKKFFSLGKSPLQVTALDFERGEDARIQQVRVAFNEGPERKISGNDFRSVVGFQDLKSTLFEAKEQGEGFNFKGRGFGHGVGLCQWGSRALGQQGMKYADILRHYYPLARLK